MASKIQAILARDVIGLGHIGDLVKVAPGFLRNYLLPKRMALPVSKQRVSDFEHQKQIVQHQLNKLKAVSEEMRDRIEVQKFTIEVKAGDQGKIFGSVGSRDIESALLAQGFNVNHRDIKLDSPIKTIGMHEVAVRLEGGVMAKVKVILAPIEEAKLETETETALQTSLPEENTEE